MNLETWAACCRVAETQPDLAARAFLREASDEEQAAMLPTSLWREADVARFEGGGLAETLLGSWGTLYLCGAGDFFAGKGCALGLSEGEMCPRFGAEPRGEGNGAGRACVSVRGLYRLAVAVRDRLAAEDRDGQEFMRDYGSE